MNHFLGRIIKGGIYITSEIPILLDDIAGKQTSAWTGQFALPAGCDVGADPCRLQLEDGRIGDIVIYRTDGGSDRTTIARFRGVGLLRRAS